MLVADPEALSDGRARELLWTIGDLAFDLGGYDAACSAFEALIEVRERALGPDHHLVQAARSMLALALKELGDLPRARELEEQVLAAFERLPPPDENELHKARMSLAATLGQSGDYAGARPLIEETLARWEETLAPGDANLLRGRQYLLNVLMNAGAAPRGARRSPRSSWPRPSSRSAKRT